MTEQVREYTFRNVMLDNGMNGKAKVRITLRDGDTDKPELSIVGFFYERGRHDCSLGGQCLDDLMKPNLRKDKQFCELHRLWKCYHLNGMHAGTPKQENVIDTAEKSGELPENASYTQNIECLKRHGVYIDDGYQYGTGWLYEAIPDDDLALIRRFVTK